MGRSRGGSVANTIAGFANLGGRAAYIGRVKDDQLGEIFNHDMRSLGVDIRLKAAPGGAPTARSHVLITEDGQPAFPAGARELLDLERSLEQGRRSLELALARGKKRIDKRETIRRREQDRELRRVARRGRPRS